MNKNWIVFVCLIHVSIYGITIGSYNTISRQGQVIFPSEDIDNAIIGFTYMEEGFILEDGKTTCSIDNQFEFAGNMFFNGGTLYLLNDFIIRQGARAFSPPTIYGNSRKIILPFVQQTAILPASFYPNFVTGLNTANAISSLDWNYTSQWIAYALSTGSSDTIELSFFDGTTAVDKYSLNPDAGASVSSMVRLGSTTINSLRWNPAVNVLAVGANPSASDELLIYEFDDTTTMLTEADSSAIGDSVTALAWHPTGTWLAIATANTTDEVRIFSFDSGTNTITSLAANDLSPNRSVGINAMSWNNTGDYLAVGTSSDGSADELLVYYFDESTITVTASVDIGATVSSLDWHPTYPLLAVGLSEGTQRTRIYSFNSATATLTELTNARTNEFFAVNSVQWHKDGLMLLVNKEPYIGFETQIYIYNPIAQTLTLYNQAKQIDVINDARWAPTGLFFAMGGLANSLYIHSSDIAAAKLIDVNFFIRSKLNFIGAVLFSGTSTIDAANNVIDISSADKLLVGSGSTLLFQNLTLKGVSDDTFEFEDDTVKVIFNNVSLLLDGVWTVSKGSLEFKNNVRIGGDGMLLYQTTLTSTIDTQSTLILDEGMTFSYDPILNNSKDLIELTDNSSVLNLNGATLHTTLSGMNIKKGILKISYNSGLSTEQNDTLDEGITFGTGIGSDDCTIIIVNDVELNCLQGTLKYKNTEASSLKLLNSKSAFHMNDNTKLQLFEDIDFGNGRIVFDDNTILAIKSGKSITGSIVPLGQLIRINFTS